MRLEEPKFEVPRQLEHCKFPSWAQGEAQAVCRFPCSSLRQVRPLQMPSPAQRTEYCHCSVALTAYGSASRGGMTHLVSPSVAFPAMHSDAQGGVLKFVLRLLNQKFRRLLVIVFFYVEAKPFF